MVGDLEGGLHTALTLLLTLLLTYPWMAVLLTCQ